MADPLSAHIQVGILTVSDSCFNGTAIDRSGESLKQLVESGKLISGTVVTKDILPDEYDQIKAKLLHWSDNLKLDLILSTGGTGFSLRDVTPEATKAVLEREALGMAVAMLKGSLEITPLAMLTRLACGTRGKTLIINLPGSTKGSAECFEIASKGIPHAVDLLRGHKQSVEKTHSSLQGEGIKSAHGGHHHQLHFPLTQARLVETVSTNEYLPASWTPPESSAVPHLRLNQKLSPPILELDTPTTTRVAFTKKPTTNFTSEVPGSPATNTATSSTLHFWKTLLSLSEAARMDLINLVPQTPVSHLSEAARMDLINLVPQTTVSHLSEAARMDLINLVPQTTVSHLSEAARMDLINLVPQTTVSRLSEAARMDLINLVPQTTVSHLTVSAQNTHAVVPVPPMPTHPGLFCHDQVSLAAPASTDFKLSPDVSADSHSYASTQTSPAVRSSSATQPTFADCTLHYHSTAPSLLDASAVLSGGHNVSLPHVPSFVHPYAASTLNSSTHTQLKFPLHYNKTGEPPEDKYAGFKNNAEVNLPTVETVMRSGPFTLMPVCADSTTCFSTSPRMSPLTTSSYKSAITCHDTVERHRRQHPTSCINKDCLPPTSVVLSSNELSSLHDNLAIKYINTFHHSEDTKCITQNHPLVHTARTAKVEIPLEDHTDSCHRVCTRERKPVVDCSGNPLVQILLPCSKHLHTDVPAVQNICTSAVTNIKKSSLRRIVRKNRTRILNILKKQNKVRKVCLREVKMSSHSRIQHAPQSAAEAYEDIDASLDIDIENEDSVDGSHHSFILTNSEQLRDSSHLHDVTTHHGVEFRADNIISAGRYEISDHNQVRLYTQPGDQSSEVDVAALPANQYQEMSHTSTGTSHLLCADKDSSMLPKNSDSHNYLENLLELSHMSASEGCENDRTLPYPAPTLSLIAKWGATPVKGMTTIKTAKIHNVRQQGELFYVPVGESFKEFIKEHPMIQGIYLHKGKREIKKPLAQLCRQYDVSDKMTTWRRGSEILERNCFDDYFELTEAGRKEQEEVLSSRKRDQYIVNWYVWCPGHGNCRRKCGGYGACARGCRGMQHKQDRHNCSLMVNMKLLLSDLSTWRVNITGTHVPCKSGIMWSPPVSGCRQNNQSAKSYHSVSEVTKQKQIFHPKKAAMENSRISDWRAAALTPFTPDVWSIIEASDESGILANTCSASPESESNLKATSVEASTSIPTKKRISKMLSSLKRRREERMTTYKLFSGNTKNVCSSLSAVNERQTVASSCEYMKNNNSIQPVMNHANIECVFDSSNNLKCRSVYKKDTFTVSVDGVSKSVLNQVSSIRNKGSANSTQGQLLSSELLHYLTCSLPQTRTPTPVISTAGDVNLISHKQALPSSYSHFLENTLTSESNCALNIKAGFESPNRKNLEVTSVNLPSLSDISVDLDRLSSVDIQQPEVFKIQSLKRSSCLQEDLVSSTGSSVQCKETLNNSEIFPTLSFEQPFLSENTLGEILQQASVEFHYNLEEEADNSAVCMDTSLSDFSSLDSLNFPGKCQVDQSNSVQQQYSKCEETYHQPGTSNGSQSPDLQHFSSEENQQFLVPDTDPVMLDSFMRLNGLLPLSEKTKSNAHIYPVDAITANAHPSCPSLSTSQISSLSVSPQFFSCAAAAAEDLAEHDNSSCENLPAHMQEMLPTLPSYREATLALAEQLGLGQSNSPL